jgi:hypothetical protein
MSVIVSLMLDLDDAVDFPGNTGTALGRPLAAYPFLAARNTGEVRRYYVVTGSPAVKAVALQNDAVIIDPPPVHDAPDAEAQLRKGLSFILDDLKTDKETVELLAVFFSNAPAVTGGLLEEGIDALRADATLDSAVSVSPFNRWNPFFAKGENASTHLLEPFVPGKADKRGDVWYPDWGVQVLRPKTVEAAAAGTPPFPWLGKKVLPLKQWGGGPIDYQWQIPSAEYWLKKHGYSDLSASMELQPQPKLQPKTDRR